MQRVYNSLAALIFLAVMKVQPSYADCGFQKLNVSLDGRGPVEFQRHCYGKDILPHYMTDFEHNGRRFYLTLFFPQEKLLSISENGNITEKSCLVLELRTSIRASAEEIQLVHYGFDKNCTGKIDDLVSVAYMQHDAVDYNDSYGMLPVLKEYYQAMLLHQMIRRDIQKGGSAKK